MLTSSHLYPLPQVPKVVYDIAPPPFGTQDPICYVNFFYEYKVMLIGNAVSGGGGGGNDLKKNF